MFVRQTIPEQEKQEIARIFSPANDGKPPMLNFRLFDEQRKAFLLMGQAWGGPISDSEERYKFLLSIDGELLSFIAVNNFHLRPSLKNKPVEWLVSSIYPPPSSLKESDLKNVIADALTAYGCSWYNDGFEVVVDFSE